MVRIAIVVVLLAGSAFGLPPQPTDLIEVITRESRTVVRSSWGELAHECFTDENLKRFIADGVHQKVAERLKRDPGFIAIVKEIGVLPNNRRDDLLSKARQTARPTWAMMGFIDPQGRGQTSAGRKADLLVAGAIVDSLSRMLRDLNVQSH